MKLEEIMSLWEQDSPVDTNDIMGQSSKVASLHGKYYKIYLNERARYRTIEAELKSLYLNKYQYYNGTLDEETLKAKGWKPFALKVLKSDIGTYIEADEEYTALHTRLQLQQDKLEYLESIIKVINNRNFQIKNIIEWYKFTNGVN